MHISKEHRGECCDGGGGGGGGGLTGEERLAASFPLKPSPHFSFLCASMGLVLMFPFVDCQFSIRKRSCSFISMPRVYEIMCDEGILTICLG